MKNLLVLISLLFFLTPFSFGQEIDGSRELPYFVIDCKAMGQEVFGTAQERDSGMTREQQFKILSSLNIEENIKLHIADIINWIYDFPKESPDRLANVYYQQCAQHGGKVINKKAL